MPRIYHDHCSQPSLFNNPRRADATTIGFDPAVRLSGPLSSFSHEGKGCNPDWAINLKNPTIQPAASENKKAPAAPKIRLLPSQFRTIFYSLHDYYQWWSNGWYAMDGNRNRRGYGRGIKYKSNPPFETNMAPRHKSHHEACMLSLRPDNWGTYPCCRARRRPAEAGWHFGGEHFWQSLHCRGRKGVVRRSGGGDGDGEERRDGGGASRRCGSRGAVLHSRLRGDDHHFPVAGWGRWRRPAIVGPCYFLHAKDRAFGHEPVNRRNKKL